MGTDGESWLTIAEASALEAIRASILREPHGLDLPRRLLDEYQTQRAESRLFTILAEARRVRDCVDRLVIVADRITAAGTRLLVDSCCHPFHDQLPRGDRGGRPRLLWLDAHADPDRIQGLLDVVVPEGRPPSIDLLDQWALLAVDSPFDEEALLARAEIVVEAMAAACGTDGVRERVIAIARPSGRLAVFVDAIGCTDRCHDEPNLGAPIAVFSWPSLLPAAIAGINIVRLLEGADAMLLRFAEAPIESNPALVDAWCRHVAARDHGLTRSLFVAESPGLAEFSTWMEHMQTDPLGAPSIVTLLESGESRRAFTKALSVTRSAAQNPHITIRLPRLDEHALGQLLQVAILSARVATQLRARV